VEEGAGHAQVDELGHARTQIVEALHAEGGGHPRRGAKGVDEDGRVETFHLLEEEGAVGLGGSLVDPGRGVRRLERTGEAGWRAGELTVLLEVGDEGAEVVEGHRPTRDTRASRANPR